MTPPEPRDAAELDVRVIQAHIASFDGQSGSVTLHIHQGKVTRIERIQSFSPTSTSVFASK